MAGDLWWCVLVVGVQIGRQHLPQLQPGTSCGSCSTKQVTNEERVLAVSQSIAACLCAVGCDSNLPAPFCCECSTTLQLGLSVNQAAIAVRSGTSMPHLTQVACRVHELNFHPCATAAHPPSATGVMYIFGLNFKKGDVALAKNQMDTIFREIPYYAIMSFELGNEVSSNVI
jgi:hypothetical protein